MGLTDEKGDPIPADDPRLPSAEDTAEKARQAEAMVIRLAQRGVNILPDILEVRAEVAALVQTFVPPDPETPIRRLFLHRVEAAKVSILEEIARDIQEAQTKARLVVPEMAPTSPLIVKGR